MSNYTKKKGTNKTREVLKHLQTKGSITSLEAINTYGATRLSSIIFNLRKAYDIRGVKMRCSDRFGNNAPYTKYIYCGELTNTAAGANV